MIYHHSPGKLLYCILLVPFFFFTEAIVYRKLWQRVNVQDKILTKTIIKCNLPFSLPLPP